MNYFSYNLNDSPNGMDKNDKADDNLNNILRSNEAADNSSAVIISESELEKHLQLLDIILEMEIVISNSIIIIFFLLIGKKNYKFFLIKNNSMTNLHKYLVCGQQTNNERSSKKSNCFPKRRDYKEKLKFRNIFIPKRFKSLY